MRCLRKIDYIAKFLGIGAKIHTNYDMWKKIVLDNDQKSLIKMGVYCKGDVSLLEKVYDKLSPHLPTKTHHGVVAGQSKFSCPHDGSTNMRYVRTRITAAGIKRYVLQCKDCGRYHTVSEKVYNDFLKQNGKNKKSN
jgi:type VI protein secretion system component Hcp